MRCAKLIGIGRICDRQLRGKPLHLQELNRTWNTHNYTMEPALFGVANQGSQPAQRARILRQLWPGDDFIRHGWKDEPYTAITVEFEGRGDIEIGHLNFLLPCPAGPIVAADVHHAIDDGVVADVLLVSVAKDERGRRLRGCAVG